MTEAGRRLAELAEEVREERRAALRSSGPRVAPGPPGRRTDRSDRNPITLTVRRMVMAGAVLVLPFLALLRGSTWLYSVGLGTWPALAVAATLTVLLLASYILAAAHWLRHRRAALPTGPGTTKRLIKGAGILVVVYCAFGLVYLSGANANGDGVRAEYRSLHPHLRLAVGTLVLADGDLLVTDATRTVEDYAAMGLPPNQRSLHLEQDDGWAHAVDLRTTGRTGLRNALTQLYFEALGFRTLRHVGTADHLHVSLPPPDR